MKHAAWFVILLALGCDQSPPAPPPQRVVATVHYMSNNGSGGVAVRDAVKIDALGTNRAAIQFQTVDGQWITTSSYSIEWKGEPGI